MSKKESRELSDPRFAPEVLTARYFPGSKLAVRREIGRGRFVVAASRLAAGSIVIDALPYAFSVEDELKRIACGYCLKPSLETMNELLATTSISSVDAVRLNELIDAGEPMSVIQHELALHHAKVNGFYDEAMDAEAIDQAYALFEAQLAASSPDQGTTAQPQAPSKAWTLHCDECQQVWYCSEACSASDAPLHAFMCPWLRRLRHKSWAGSDLTMARTILHIFARRHMEVSASRDVRGSTFTSAPIALRCGGDEHSSHAAREVFAKFNYDFDVMSLVSNERDIQAKTLAHRRPLVTFIRKICDAHPELGIGDSAQIIALIGKIDQNTFGVRFDRNLSYGFGLFPSMSYFNHTCAPNVCVIQHNTVLRIMALRDIEEGEEVAISYIETNRPTKDRRRALQTEYNFYCRCTRCSAQTQPDSMLVDEFVQRYVCKTPSCDGKGLLIPLTQDPQGRTHACNICQSTWIINRN